MGTITVSAFVTVDGVQRDPVAWIGDWFSDDLVAHATGLLGQADAMVMGRGTYEYFAERFPHIPGPHAERVNTMRKLVVSSSLSQVGWQNAELVRGDAFEVGMGLLGRGQGSYVMYGYGSLAARLIHNGFVGRLEFLVVPTLRGSGSSMVQESLGRDLVLSSSRTFESGVVGLTYTPQWD